MICDLHTHSTFSDGTLTPEELVLLAEKENISAVALCDHNTVNGIERFADAGLKSKVKTVPGIEISTEHNSTELHILGLFLPENRLPEISELMAQTKSRKENSNIELCKNLSADGYKISYDKIKQANGGAYINRAHIASELMKKGYTSSVAEAFNTLLSPEYGYYKEPQRLKALGIINYLSSIGAVPVLAHPFLNMAEEEIRCFLPVAKSAGLIGMETRYSLYDEKTQKCAEKLAEFFEIKESGGSDFHGDNKPNIPIGKPAVPYEFYEKLRR